MSRLGATLVRVPIATDYATWVSAGASLLGVLAALWIAYHGSTEARRMARNSAEVARRERERIDRERRSAFVRAALDEVTVVRSMMIAPRVGTSFYAHSPNEAVTSLAREFGGRPEEVEPSLVAYRVSVSRYNDAAGLFNRYMTSGLAYASNRHEYEKIVNGEASTVMATLPEAEEFLNGMMQVLDALDDIARSAAEAAEEV
jgi:hypothetical protein